MFKFVHKFVDKSFGVFLILHLQHMFNYDHFCLLFVFNFEIPQKHPQQMCFSMQSLLHSNCGMSWRTEATMCFLPRSFGDRNGANILQVISNWLIKSPMRENKLKDSQKGSTVIRVDSSQRVDSGVRVQQVMNIKIL